MPCDVSQSVIAYVISTTIVKSLFRDSLGRAISVRADVPLHIAIVDTACRSQILLGRIAGATGGEIAIQDIVDVVGDEAHR